MRTLSTSPVDQYLDHLRVRNLRPSTVYSRHRALVRIATHLGHPLIEATELELRAWQTDRCKQIQPEPVRTELSHARQFFRWCVRENLIDRDPTLRLDLPRVSRRVPRPIPDRTLAEAMTEAPADVRVALALAAFAGLRACEIAQLAWAEVSTGPNPHLRIVEGKGGHGRLIPLSHALAAELNELRWQRGPVIRRRDGQAGPCAPHRISSMVNGYLHSVGVPETLHQCRHRFATVSYQACRDIRAVQDLLGHASPTTTSVYAMAASEVAVAAVEAAGVVSAA